MRELLAAAAATATARTDEAPRVPTISHGRCSAHSSPSQSRVFRQITAGEELLGAREGAGRALPALCASELANSSSDESESGVTLSQHHKRVRDAEVYQPSEIEFSLPTAPAAATTEGTQILCIHEVSIYIHIY